MPKTNRHENEQLNLPSKSLKRGASIRETPAKRLASTTISRTYCVISKQHTIRF